MSVGLVVMAGGGAFSLAVTLVPMPMLIRKLRRIMAEVVVFGCSAVPVLLPSLGADCLHWVRSFCKRPDYRGNRHFRDVDCGHS